ncbi:MAG TPA: TonB-dependent receptor, partial [Gemmatimonadales bacterium]
MGLPRLEVHRAGLLLPFVLLLLIPTHLRAQAQASTGVIRGTVTDSAGRPLDNATVSLRHLGTNAERTLTTNTSGVYVATLLRVGQYDIRARALGFREKQRDTVAVTLGETVEANFSLTPQAVQLEELTVAAPEPEVDVTKSESATHLGVEAVQGLPNNGRNIFNYTTLTPNVATVQGPDGDELSIGGQRGIHNNVSVDGADFNNPFFGEQRGGQRPAFTFNLDAVQDFVVISDGANAEFGRSGGGFVNIITKSGTNDFHGSAHYFGKYDALSADFSHTFPAGGTTGFTPDFQQHQFGATLGGPIARNKVF